MQAWQLAGGLRTLGGLAGSHACMAVLARVLPLLAHGSYQSAGVLASRLRPGALDEPAALALLSWDVLGLGQHS